MEKVTSLEQARIGGLMHFAFSAGFGDFNRHFGARMEKGRKEIRAVLQLFPLGPVSSLLI